MTEEKEFIIKITQIYTWSHARKKHRWIICVRAHRWWLPSLSLFLLRFCRKCFSFHCERVRAIVANENHRHFNLKNVWNRSKTQPISLLIPSLSRSVSISLSPCFLFRSFDLADFVCFSRNPLLTERERERDLYLCLDPSSNCKSREMPTKKKIPKKRRFFTDSHVPVAAQTQLAFFSLLCCNVHMDSMTHLLDSTVHWTPCRKKKSRVRFARLPHTTKRLLSSICNTFNLHLLNVSGLFFHSLTTYFFLLLFFTF